MKAGIRPRKNSFFLKGVFFFIFSFKINEIKKLEKNQFSEMKLGNKTIFSWPNLMVCDVQVEKRVNMKFHVKVKSMPKAWFM